MPLRCVDEHGTTIEADACSDEQWKTLRERSRKERNLKMPCCTVRAVLKTSKLGTRFFAHKARGACTWKPETNVHLHLKRVALKAAREAGWEAQTEVTEGTPEDEHWTADVLAWKGDRKIAVEVQWSGQTDEETWQRQRRYERSGVEGVWLLRQPGFPISEELPAACIGRTLEEGLSILIPKHEGGTARDRQRDDHWTQTLEPEKFMRALFEEQFRFGIGHLRTIMLNIHTGVIDCWRCPSTTRIVTFLKGRVGPHELMMRLHGGPCTYELADLVAKAVKDRKDIGSIKERFSRMQGQSYLSNGCAKCDALIGEHFEYRAWYEHEEIVGTVEWELDEENRNRGYYETNRWGVWSRSELDGMPVEQGDDEAEGAWKVVVSEGTGRARVWTEPLRPLPRKEEPDPAPEPRVDTSRRTLPKATKNSERPGFQILGDFPVPREPLQTKEADPAPDVSERGNPGSGSVTKGRNYHLPLEFPPPRPLRSDGGASSK